MFGLTAWWTYTHFVLENKKQTKVYKSRILDVHNYCWFYIMFWFLQTNNKDYLLLLYCLKNWVSWGLSAAGQTIIEPHLWCGHRATAKYRRGWAEEWDLPLPQETLAWFSNLVNIIFSFYCCESISVKDQ